MVASGNRLLSFFIFLSGCDAGGCTAFPRLKQRFPPEAGSGLVWYNLDRDGAPDERRAPPQPSATLLWRVGLTRQPLPHRTLHAGEPVERGEKWGLNIWLRERPRRSPTARNFKSDVAVSVGPMMARPGMRAPSNAATCCVSEGGWWIFSSRRELT